MADLELRLNKDMLVMSSPVSRALDLLGMTSLHDQAYALLFEPEVIEEVYKLESMTGVQCVVADTAMIVPAELARLGMRDDAQAMADNAIKLAQAVKPQHVIVEIAPCALPLDASSKSSLLENRDQYTRAAKLYDDASFDAFFLNGFTRVADLKCALMGIRKVSDKLIIASVDVDGEGVLRRRGAASVAVGSESAMQESIEDAIYAMEDLGADVVGFASGAPVDDLVALTNRARMSCGLPTLVQLDVASRDPEQEAPSYKNPYFDPDTMVDAAEALRAAGAQVLRAVGDASPAYTGALVAAVDRLDVAQDLFGLDIANDAETDLDSLAERLRDRVASALGRTADRLDERHEQ